MRRKNNDFAGTARQARHGATVVSMTAPYLA